MTETYTRLTVEARIACCVEAVRVLRELAVADTTMRYQGFAKAIGLMPQDAKWQPWHRRQVSDILYMVLAIEGQCVGAPKAPLQHERVVTANGMPGLGVTRVPNIALSRMRAGRMTKN